MSENPATVGQLLRALTDAFPLEWAEEWDAVGLRVGDPAWPAARTLVTLDANAASVSRAIEAGCGLLVTHHPPFLEPLGELTPQTDSSAVALGAARAGVAIISMHTNLDRAPDGATALPMQLGLSILDSLEEPVPGRPDDVRLGRLCSVESTTLLALANRVGARLGVTPRVWGAPDLPVSRVAVGNGSVRSLIPAARAAGADVLLGGEVRYHDALDAAGSGLAIIEAGHDATEWPMVAVLARIVRSVVGDDAVIEEPASIGWWTAKGE